MRWVFSKAVGQKNRQHHAAWIVAAIFAVFAHYATPAAADSPPIGDGMANFQAFSDPMPVPETLRYVNEAGETVPLSGLRGQWVLVNLWATWCAPCIREMPDLDHLAAMYQGKNLRVLTLSQDRGGRRVVDKFFDKHGFQNLPRALDPKGAVARGLGTRGLPTSYLINPNSEVVGKLEGIAAWHGENAQQLFDYYLNRTP